ncbi:vitamin K epoxide reductase family protein [Gordonia aurantiaca]|uniref:vitamin K epoxide reductase family protein n=1 Tax=Gordonia sp. B21 TaxID=3151852 RepID=UPI0032652C4B
MSDSVATDTDAEFEPGPDTDPDERALLAEAVRSWTRIVAWVLTVGGAIAFIASFTLTVEKIELIENPDYIPSCNFSPVLSCGSVMATPQAGVFGFPNPLLGIAGFAVVITTGVALLAGARLAGWYWAGLQVGVTAAMAFVCWLIYTSLYTIGALCPYCMVVWSMTLPIFVFVSVRNLHASGLTSRSGVALAVARGHALVLVGFVAVVIALIAVRFWDYWSSLY